MLDTSDADYLAAAYQLERRGRLTGLIVLGVVLVGIVLFLFFVGFSASANATGSCGGG